MQTSNCESTDDRNRYELSDYQRDMYGAERKCFAKGGMSRSTDRDEREMSNE